MTYDQIIAQVAEMMSVPVTDSEYLAFAPAMLDYGQNRINRELDFLATVSRTSTVLTLGSRLLQLPTGIIAINTLNLITPSGSTGDTGIRHQMRYVSVETLNRLWTNQIDPALRGVPKQYARVTPTVGIVGPTPDAAYNVEFFGTFIQSGLSPTNANTFIGDNMPDLLIAACMIYVNAFYKNFGAQSEDPAAAQSWENQYSTLRQGVLIEELRRKSQSVSWTAYQPSPIANTPRDKEAVGGAVSA